VIETTTTQAPTTTAEVLGTSIVQNPTTTEAPATTAAPAVAGEQVTQAPQSQVLGEQLARTGDDSRQMVFVAGLALLLGGAAIFASDKLATAKK
jgi:LPXTG-motif cell wall-anchored protein